MGNFCPQCGSPLAPGQNFCPSCGFKLAASVAPQQPAAPKAPVAPQQPVAPQAPVQPQQPVAPQPVAPQAPAAPQYPQQPQYQQPVQPQYPQYQYPQYQQPQYQQPAYGAPAAPKKINNLWAVITGATVAFFSLLLLVFGLIGSSFRGFMNMHSLIGLCLFFSGVGLSVFYLGIHPFKAPVPQNQKIFSLAFVGSLISAWLFVMIGFMAIRSADVLFIFALLFFIAAGVFGVLSNLDLFKKLNFLTWGFAATLFNIFMWFIFSILNVAAASGLGFFTVMFVLTALLTAGAAVMFTLHFMKAPETKLF
ncbi:MAG: zinc ribbon domain-containing protein [Bacteroidales bacterium]|nr:zinc ribbon domain-containing protein [Bacteroidales bacterium]